MHTETKVPERSASLAWRRIEDEVIIVTPCEGLARVLNASGSRIWELIDGVRSTADIVTELGREFDAPAGPAEEDVAAFLAELAQKKLVRFKE
ncbi:MAG: pyrroloquinoline quinone biosynthesis peptide chaperone PqqD [Candidatus Omnitrophica bacterium]|nr:pyrroloquinoline quinone biosynthesis peptide chaperone PqqD [Candidatus Omnitrophota bacterium]